MLGVFITHMLCRFTLSGVMADRCFNAIGVERGWAWDRLEDGVMLENTIPGWPWF